MIKFTLAITSYNRVDLTVKSFEKIVNDERIDEVVILDDCSEFSIYRELVYAANISHKVKVIRQGRNRGMMQNKADAIAFARNQWVILFDSDNVLSEEYLDAIPWELKPDIIYCPSFARPNFDMRSLEGKIIDRNTAKLYANEEAFHWSLNTCNYVVNRDEYAKIYKFDSSIRGTDTAYFAHNWLAAGNKFFIMPEAYYDHLVHEGSEFMKHVNYNMAKAKEIMNQIKQL